MGEREQAGGDASARSGPLRRRARRLLIPTAVAVAGGLIIGAAIVGGTFSVRQVLLHIAPVPGEPTGYGSAVLGMHLYSWAAVVFLTAIAGTAGFLCVVQDEAPGTRREPSGFERGALLFAALLCLANVVATFAECGLGPCCENGPCP